MACRATGIDIIPPANLAEIVRPAPAFALYIHILIREQLLGVGSRFFADVKKKVTPLVERYYGFETSKARETLNDNMTKAQYLKIDSAFINGDEEPALPYRHPIIQKAINVIWFSDRSCDGIVFQYHFNPLPYEAFALVLAVVRGFQLPVKYSIDDVLQREDRVLYRRMEQWFLD